MSEQENARIPRTSWDLPKGKSSGVIPDAMACSSRDAQSSRVTYILIIHAFLLFNAHVLLSLRTAVSIFRLT